MAPALPYLITKPRKVVEVLGVTEEVVSQEALAHLMVELSQEIGRMYLVVVSQLENQVVVVRQK